MFIKIKKVRFTLMELSKIKQISVGILSQKALA